jgi:hypothetical protein
VVETLRRKIAGMFVSTDAVVVTLKQLWPDRETMRAGPRRALTGALEDLVSRVRVWADKYHVEAITGGRRS